MSSPTIGRLVHYTLNEGDADLIKASRRVTDHQSPPAGRGNNVEEGQTYPALVVRTWGSDVDAVNLQVFLDGNDTHWVTSRTEGLPGSPGHWTWPARDDSNAEAIS